jgi:large subunit ribosomal protein L29
MKSAELRNKSVAELKAELIALLRAQFGLRVQHATQQLTKTSEMRKLRRGIARVRTLLGEKARRA